MPQAKPSEEEAFRDFMSDLDLTLKPLYDSVDDRTKCILRAMPVNRVLVERDGRTEEEAYDLCISTILRKWRNLAKFYQNSRLNFLEDSFSLLKLPLNFQTVEHTKKGKLTVSLYIGDKVPYSTTSERHTVEALKDQLAIRFISDAKRLLGNENVSKQLCDTTMLTTTKRKWDYRKVSVELPNIKENSVQLTTNKDVEPYSNGEQSYKDIESMIQPGTFLIVPLREDILKDETPVAYIVKVMRKKAKLNPPDEDNKLMEVDV